MPKSLNCFYNRSTCQSDTNSQVKREKTSASIRSGHSTNNKKESELEYAYHFSAEPKQRHFFSQPSEAKAFLFSAERSKGISFLSRAKQRLPHPPQMQRAGKPKKTGLIFAALNEVPECSVKKSRLFERSEFRDFSETKKRSSEENAALTFWFFCVKAKEQKSQ